MVTGGSAPRAVEVVRAGGFTTGGFNFDAKVRRQSIDAVDLLHGHVGAIDTRGTVRILRGADAGGPISVRVAGVPRALVAGPDSTWLAIVAQGAWIVDEQKLARGARPEVLPENRQDARARPRRSAGVARGY